jgi:amino acid transporter
MEEMIAARFNIYWYLSFIVPAIVMLLATFWRRKSLLILGILISLAATYILCNISVQEKWDTRMQIAQTEEESKYATADGANIVFTVYITGPFEAILHTSFWGILGWKVWPRIRQKKRKSKMET